MDRGPAVDEAVRREEEGEVPRLLRLQERDETQLECRVQVEKLS